MARSSRKDTELHRQQVIDGAATLLRERGVAGVNVGQLMAEAGLTHGGFYRHFASKDELVGLALEKALADQRDWVSGQRARADRLLPLARAPRRPRPRLHDGRARVEVARADEASRETFAEASTTTSRRSPASGGEREEALARYATMVGALVISRATAGDPISDAVLEAARRSAPAVISASDESARPRPRRRRPDDTERPQARGGRRSAARRPGPR